MWHPLEVEVGFVIGPEVEDFLEGGLTPKDSYIGFSKAKCELERSTDFVTSSPTPYATTLVREILLYLLARLEKVSPTIIILDALAPTVSSDPSTTSLDLACGPSQSVLDYDCIYEGIEH